jgi:hypothetical protein
LPVAIVTLAASVAGADVVTSVSGSAAVLTGDESPNALVIEPASDGIVVTGRGGTLVDGSADGVTLSGVRRLTVKLGSGADEITLTNVSLPDGLNLRLGRGNDDVVLDGVRAGATRIRTGNGYDFVSVFGPSRLDRLAIETSNGRDVVDVDGASIFGDLDVDAGSGDDDVTIVATQVSDDVRVRLGNDDDFLAIADVVVDDDTDVDGESGDDALVFAGYVWIGDDLDVDGFDDVWWW